MDLTHLSLLRKRLSKNNFRLGDQSRSHFRETQKLLHKDVLGLKTSLFSLSHFGETGPWNSGISGKSQGGGFWMKMTVREKVRGNHEKLSKSEKSQGIMKMFCQEMSYEFYFSQFC